MVEIESTQNLRRPVYVSLADQFVEDKKKVEVSRSTPGWLFAELVWHDQARSVD